MKHSTRSGLYWATIVGFVLISFLGGVTTLIKVWQDQNSIKASNATITALAREIKQIADATHLILTNGTTSSAKNAKQAAEAAKAGDVVIAHVENQLDMILSGTKLGLVNRDLICSVARVVHVTSIIIRKDCFGSPAG